MTPTVPPTCGEKDALGDQLTEQARARRAEGRPHPHLARSSSRPADQQARDVQAGDEQHGTGRRQQCHQRDLRRADDLGAQRSHVHGPSRVTIRILLPEALGDLTKVVLSLRRGDAGTHAADDAQVVLVPVHSLRNCRQRARPPDVDRLAVGVGPIVPADMLHAGREHARDLDGPAGKRDGLADDGAIGFEPAGPERMRQDHDVLTPRRLVVSRELAPGEHLVAEEREEPRRHAHAAQTLGPLATQLEVAPLESRQ